MNQLRHLVAGLLLALSAVGAHPHDFKAGNISIADPHARATAPGQPTGGAYLRLDNHGPADRLVAVRTTVSNAVQLHVSSMEGDVMRMREVDAIDVPANKTVLLQPNGSHIMLVGLKAPLKSGDHFPLTLKFQKAGEVTVDVVVQAVGAGGDKTMKH